MIFPPPKAQYDFIHYALSELAVCGETEMTASRLRSFVESLRDGEQNNSNLIQHLQVFLFHNFQISFKSYKFFFHRSFLSFFGLRNTVVMLSFTNPLSIFT